MCISADVVVVGATLEDSGATGVNGDPSNRGARDSGAACVFVRVGPSWLARAYLKASNTGSDDEFGTTVGVSGDTLAAGAPEEDSSSTGVNSTPNDFSNRAGAAYAFTIPAPEVLVYCTGKTTSEGCVPFLSASGSGFPSLSDTTPFFLRGSDPLPTGSGVLTYGFGKTNLDFHGGKLCVKSPVRTAGKAAKSKASVLCTAVTTTGRLTSNFNIRIQSGSDPLLSAGQKVFAQRQQRDAASTLLFGDNLSSAIRFTILP